VSRHRPSGPPAAELPLDDPRWVPFLAVHERFCQRLGNPDLAATDLTEALRSPRLRSMVRYMPRARRHQPELPERELWSVDDWDRHEIQYWSDGLLVAVKQPSRGFAVQVLRVYGYFFVWGPDVEEFFGGKPTAPKPGSAAAWIDELYPNGLWRLKKAKDVANEIRKRDPKGPGYTAVREEMKRRRYNRD
jgi:hypothetical protein